MKNIYKVWAYFEIHTFVFYTAGMSHTLEFKSQASDMAVWFVWFSSV